MNLHSKQIQNQINNVYIRVNCYHHIKNNDNYLDTIHQIIQYIINYIIDHTLL